jgi:hypothetical protein
VTGISLLTHQKLAKHHTSGVKPHLVVESSRLLAGGKRGRSSNKGVHAADVSPNVKVINIFVCSLLVELDEEDELN